jgi:hypothetical protein
MSAILRVYVDDRTLSQLRRVSEETGRTVEDLAEAAISEAALRSERPRDLSADLDLNPGASNV